MSWTAPTGMLSRLAILIAALSVHVQGQTPAAPKTENAKVERRVVNGSLAQTMDAWAKSAGPAQWIGYSVPAFSGDRA